MTSVVKSRRYWRACLRYSSPAAEMVSGKFILRPTVAKKAAIEKAHPGLSVNSDIWTFVEERCVIDYYNRINVLWWPRLPCSQRLIRSFVHAVVLFRTVHSFHYILLLPLLANRRYSNVPATSAQAEALHSIDGASAIQTSQIFRREHPLFIFFFCEQKLTITLGVYCSFDSHL